MGALALVSYWVVSITPRVDLPSRATTTSQAPDYVMQDFTIRQFGPDGQLESELLGHELRNYPHNDTTQVDQARGRQLSPEGRTTTFTAQRATTNKGNTIYWLEGDVFVVRPSYTPEQGPIEPRTTYQGQALTYYVDDDRLVSELPVLIKRGNDTFSANRLTYDDRSTVLTMQGRVRVLLAPRSPNS